MTRVVPDSCCRKSWVLRAMRAEKSVGRARASSSGLVWGDWGCPGGAAVASLAVRDTLLNTSWAVSDQPEVWQWVRKESERGSLGWCGFISFAHSRRAGRRLAISMKQVRPMAHKKEEDI